MSALRAFLRCERGASAAEFALVLPAALLVLFGVIDAGFYAWEINEYEKATQMGARYAVVTDVIPPALGTETYVGADCGGTPLVAGDRICAAALGLLSCDRSGCACTTSPCPGGTISPPDSTTYDALVAHMRQFQPRIGDNAVTVEYRGSGLGYAGDPSRLEGRPEIAPLVTVRVDDAEFRPISLSPFGLSVPLPDFSYSLTLEDAEGSSSS